MGDKILAVSIFVFLAILLSSLIADVECSAIVKDRFRRAGDESVTFPEIGNERMPMPEGEPSVTNTTDVTHNTTKLNQAADEESSVAVPVIIAILVIVCVVAIGAFIFYRIRRRRNADYEKKTKIQMSSTGNAGVYVDPTTSLAEGDKDKAAESPETERLNKEED